MSFRLYAHERVPDGMKRIVLEQIDQAISELTSDEIDRHKGVHQARKRFKKIRAVLRLVRAELDQDGVYRAENTWFRDVGRTLSHVRDAEAIIETLDKLRAVFANHVEEPVFTAAREALVHRRQIIADEQIDLAKQSQAIAQQLRAARLRVEAWPLQAEGFAAIGPGLARTYRQGRKARAEAYTHPTDETFHEWRKLVKHHWYHILLLQDAWPEVLEGYQRSLKALSDILGDAHDLAVLRHILLAQPDMFGGRRDIQVLLGLIDRRQPELRRDAGTLGQRIFALKPGHLFACMEQYYAAWQAEARRSAAPTEQAAL